METGYILSMLVPASGAVINTPDYKVLIGFVFLIVLLLISGLMSASEVAYFSLTPADIGRLKAEKSRSARAVLKLYENPEKLLSTILVGNNAVNIAIVILSSFISIKLFDFSQTPVLGFLIEVVVITALILFFGEIMPKVYATHNRLPMVHFMAYPLIMLEKLFSPVTSVLIVSSSFVKKRTSRRQTNISMDDLSDALEMTSEEFREEEKILKGIVKFGNINASEIMCPRVDVTTIDIKSGFKTIIPQIIESGFSRIPVYSGSFDNVAGILYVKDVLPYSNNPDSFKWQGLLRPPYFVPETKKINELLKEFQQKKIHLAVVVDEYGGTSGIITLEDILEEIVGEITDESDLDETLYRKISENRFVFDGKVLLNDFYKILSIDDDPFEDIRGESETLAGLILEITGEIPQKDRVIEFGNFKFSVLSADKRRIREISVEIADRQEGEKNNK
ncbi:MAG: gliding motility-associated protein GldE [Bacteroidales bacterium]